MKKTAKLYKAKGLYIGTSTIDGWGVFLEDPIKTGDIIEYIPVIQKVPYKDREKCGEIFTHTAFPYLDGKHFWSACGYMSMINHSKDSNVEWKIDYYNDIAFPNYYDIHYAKRIEQDVNKTRDYHEHLRNIGYVQQRNNYNGETKWIKK